MANDFRLPVHEILGIALADLARGESLAAKASLDFIQAVGFRRRDDDDPDDLGELRMVSFRYRQLDPSGKEATREVSIPLLSLVPLPLLQISKAQVEVAVQVDEARRRTSRRSVLVPPSMLGMESREEHELLGTVVPLPAPGAVPSKGVSPPMMTFRVELSQADLPAGVQSLLRAMDKNVTEKGQ